jgi:hypothetical protein
MCIQKMLGNTIVAKASDAFILSLTPKNELPTEKQSDKMQLIYARNRVLDALNKASQNLTDKEHAKLLQEKIELIKNFYRNLGGEIEDTTAKLSLLSPTKLIEGPIPSAIIASTKPEEKCKDKELAQKKEDEELRNKIIDATFQKCPSQEITDNLNLFLSLFEN